MARASIRTQLPLDTFAKLVGIHPLHFNQVEVQDLAPATDASAPFLQHEWQLADRIGREALAREIRSVEDQILPWLGFSPLAQWYEDDIATTRPNASYLNPNYKLWNEQLEHAKVLSGGVEAWTLISNEAVVYTDEDFDGYSETATVGCATTVTEAEEISICYPNSVASEWEIRPITVTIVGGVATIVCRREQLVIAAAMEELTPRSVDGLDDANFLTTVDVYRHWNDPSDQGQLEWISTTVPGGLNTQTVCLVLRDSRLGIAMIQPATWDATTEAFTFNCASWSGRPDKMLLRYYAGEKQFVMDPQWAYVITALTCAQIDRPLCGGDTVQALIKYWKEDKSLRYSSPNGDAFAWLARKSTLDNPLGTTRAAEYAWRMIQQYQLRRHS